MPLPLPPLTPLQTQWHTLYTSTLPTLARPKHPSQPHWPVRLDHCFARIILDNTICLDPRTHRPTMQWDKAIQRPALRTMSETQLREAIGLGRRIAGGEVDLGELDRVSLGVRGKEAKGLKGTGLKRVAEKKGGGRGGMAAMSMRREREKTARRNDERRPAEMNDDKKSASRALTRV